MKHSTRDRKRKQEKTAAAGKLEAGQCPTCGRRLGGAADKLLTWSGPVDGLKVNRTAVRLLRALMNKRWGSFHKAAAGTGLSRSFIRTLHRRVVELSLITIGRCCNGLRVDVEGLVRLALEQHRPGRG